MIITSRDKNVNAEINNIICKEYKVEGLSDIDSKRLLADTIKQGQMIEEEEKRMIHEVALACRGVPLLLSVFGKHLRVERNEYSFQQALDVLRKGNLDSFRDEDLGTKLMFVYDKIKDVEVKEAFLDICKYFHGWEWNLVADIVDFPKLEDLHRRTLVSKSGSGDVIVHDILRLMGVEMAGLTRISNYKELSDALEDNLVDFGNVKGLLLDYDYSLPRQSRQFHLITIESTHLEAMHKSLRVLMLGDWVTLDGPPCHRVFRNLRYLNLGDITTFPFTDPSKLHKLRVFVNRSKPGMNLSNLPSSLKRISHKVPPVECHEFANLPFQNLSSLKRFSVEATKSVKLPKEFNLPVSLVDLHLRNCMNLPKDIGHLSAVEFLILDGSDLKCLPQGFGKHKKLKHLSINDCSKLEYLSDDLGMLSSLESLRMDCCINLKALPKSLGGLVSLKTLDMKLCDLQLLPESFGELCISSLELESLYSLNKLPNNFGNMPLLKDLSLNSCQSLSSLPESFVQLKMLETLKISHCLKLSTLPKDFGRLRYLKHMTVEGCHLLKELPHGFGALPALKIFKLNCCNGFVNLPRDFTELTSLEEIRLESVPLKRIPDGFGKLKRLRFLFLEECLQLRTLSDDFENMASLELLRIRKCPELEGAMMEKILKLRNCFIADIEGSIKLLEKWEQTESETEYRIAVFTGKYLIDREVEKRPIMEAVLNGKSVEVNNTNGQLMERSSCLAGLEEGTSATLALVIVPSFQMLPSQHKKLQLFMEMARETIETNGWGKLQVVCARKYVWTAQRSTSTDEEERAEEEDIRQILLSMPKGSCALSKRVKIVSTYVDDYRDGRGNYFNFEYFIGHVVLDMEGRKSFRNFEVVRWDEISKTVILKNAGKTKDEHDYSIQNFIHSISPRFVDWGVSKTDEQSQTPSVADEDEQFQSPCVAGQSKTRELIEALKSNGIYHLHIEGRQVMVDDLHGKTIGFIICEIMLLEWIKMAQIYEDLQQDSNFVAISIPQDMGSCGHGTYTRLSVRPWATILHPQLGYGSKVPYPYFVVLDNEGQIANQNAWDLVLGWGLKFYPFTQHSIPQSFFSMESEPLLEILLHGMNILGRKRMKSKMTFLHGTPASKWLEMKSKLEQLTQMHGDFEVLYVGKLTDDELYFSNIEDLKQEYEDETQNTRWPSLSVSDWIMFWYRCRFLASGKGSNKMMETVSGLASNLRSGDGPSLVLVDNDGVVTFRGEDVVDMIYGISNGEGMDELSRGECSVLLTFVKTWFGDEIDNHPLHPQHRLCLMRWRSINDSDCYLEYDSECHRFLYKYDYVCSVCSRLKLVGCEKRSYKCRECTWCMCGSCWMEYAKQYAELLVPAKDN